MAGFKLKLTGAKKLKRAFKDASRQMRSATLAATYEEAMGTMDASQRLVPISATGSHGNKPGFLKRSAFVTKPTLNGPDIELGYSAFYATPVHERTELRHAVGQAKFLEAAVNKRQGGMLRRISRKASRNFKKKIGIRSVAARYSTKAAV